MRLSWRRRHPRVRYRAVVRFSVLDPQWRGFRAINSGAFASTEEYREYLWSPARLELRFRIFGRLAAPTYQAMAQKHDLRVLVQHSPDLPEPWLARLRELASTYPVLEPVPVPMYADARDTVLEHLSAQRAAAGSVVMLRVDDDDLLACDFLDQLAPHITPAHHGWSLSLGRGVAARVQPDGRFTDFRWRTHPFIAIGQAYVGHVGRAGTKAELSPLLPHRYVHETLPTVVDSRRVAWVHVWHPHQDSWVGQGPGGAEKALDRGLGKLVPVSSASEFADLTERFPVLAGDLERARQEQAHEVP